MGDVIQFPATQKRAAKRRQSSRIRHNASTIAQRPQSACLGSNPGLTQSYVPGRPDLARYEIVVSRVNNPNLFATLLAALSAEAAPKAPAAT